MGTEGRARLMSPARSWAREPQKSRSAPVRTSMLLRFAVRRRSTYTSLPTIERLIKNWGKADLDTRRQFFNHINNAWAVNPTPCMVLLSHMGWSLRCKARRFDDGRKGSAPMCARNCVRVSGSALSQARIRRSIKGEDRNIRARRALVRSHRRAGRRAAPHRRPTASLRSATRKSLTYGQ